MQKLMGQMRAAMERYEMVQPGDKIAVGVSGGKDSLMLLTGLAKLRAFYPVPFSLIAITADPCFGGQETDFSAIEELCRELDVPYLIRRTRLGSIIFEERKEENPCSLCARMRRGILHEMAKENGCTTLALGHHFDDAVQTFFYESVLRRKAGLLFAQKLSLPPGSMDDSAHGILRGTGYPQCCRPAGLPVVKSQCPADGCTSRKETELLVSELEKQFPDLRKKVMGAMQRAGLDHWGTSSDH